MGSCGATLQKEIQKYDPLDNAEWEQEIINVSSSDEPPFPSHITMKEALKLQIYDKIDHRGKDGRFILATIYDIRGTNFKIHYDRLSKIYDVWSDITKDIDRFYKPRSISHHPAHRLLELKKGDYVYINPTNKHLGVKCGVIETFDNTSGQIQVVYKIDKTYSYWTHLDNKQEILEFEQIHNLIILGFIRNFNGNNDLLQILSTKIYENILLFAGGDNLCKAINLKPIIKIKSFGAFCESVIINILIQNNYFEIYQHKIVYKCIQHNTNKWTIIDINDTENSIDYEIKGLEANTDYIISVESTNNVYWTSSNILTFQTKQIHISLSDAYKLNVGDQIDHRYMGDDDEYFGCFYEATITEKETTNLKIHYNGYSKHYDLWCDFQNELYRFALFGSISHRPSHHLSKLHEYDYVDINPTQKHVGWRFGTIKQFDPNSGQVQVGYQYNNQEYVYYTHLDNKYEIDIYKYNINDVIVNGYSKTLGNDNTSFSFIPNVINAIIVSFCGDDLYGLIISKPIINVKGIFCESVILNIRKNDCDEFDSTLYGNVTTFGPLHDSFDIRDGDDLKCRDRWGGWHEAHVIYHKLSYQSIPPKTKLNKYQKRNIKEIETLEAIYVHYIHWENKWNEWIFIEPGKTMCRCDKLCSIDRTSHRIAPMYRETNDAKIKKCKTPNKIHYNSYRILYQSYKFNTRNELNIIDTGYFERNVGIDGIINGLTHGTNYMISVELINQFKICISASKTIMFKTPYSIKQLNLNALISYGTIRKFEKLNKLFMIITDSIYKHISAFCGTDPILMPIPIITVKSTFSRSIALKITNNQQYGQNISKCELKCRVNKFETGDIRNIENIVNIKIGDKFDCRDRFGKWQQSQVIYHKLSADPIPEYPALNENQARNMAELSKLEAIFVHYLKFENKWDEWIFIDTNNTICKCHGVCNDENIKHRIASINTQSLCRIIVFGNNHSIDYTMNALQPDTNYEISVSGINKYNIHGISSNILKIKTISWIFDVITNGYENCIENNGKTLQIKRLINSPHCIINKHCVTASFSKGYNTGTHIFKIKLMGDVISRLYGKRYNSFSIVSGHLHQSTECIWGHDDTHYYFTGDGYICTDYDKILKKGDEWKNGDVIWMILNCDKSTLCYKINDKSSYKINIEKHKTYYPCITCIHQGSKFMIL